MPRQRKAEAITLKERASVGGNPPIYDVFLHGERHGQLYFNMTGYRGSLPNPEGGNLEIGEQSIRRFQSVAAKLNRQFRQAGA